MPEPEATQNVADLFHRYAVCQRDVRIRITAIGGPTASIDGLHVGDETTAWLTDADSAILEVGRALFHSLGDNWELAA
jgi:hypothetical protein